MITVSAMNASELKFTKNPRDSH